MLVRARTLIEGRGGTVLAGPSGTGRRTRLKVHCGNPNHEPWNPLIANLLYAHSWCPTCYGNQPITIEEMRELAAGRGGKCLSDVCKGNKVKLKWQCAFGHEWDATPGNVKNHRSWCGDCRINVGEELVRATLEEAFPGYDFSKTRRLPWMGGLELDGYNEELRLAFEYQGIQHAQRVQHFQRDEEAFESQLERDALTAERCTDNEIVLLVIPHTIRYVDIRQYIRSELEELAYDIAPTTATETEFYNKVRALGPTTARQFARAKQVIAEKGGKCISTQYIGYRVPLTIRCRRGHTFMASLEAIDQPPSRGPRFCQECGGTKKLETSILRNRVECCGYEFHGVKSVRMPNGDMVRYMTVQCPMSHGAYKVTVDNFGAKEADNLNDEMKLPLRPKKGCKWCAKDRSAKARRLDIDSWCENNGVQILDEYRNNSTNYWWMCDSGHIFKGRQDSMRQRADEICIPCRLERFADQHDLELLTQWDESSNQFSKNIWRCRTCYSIYSSPLTSLSSAHKLSVICNECDKHK